MMVTVVVVVVIVVVTIVIVTMVIVMVIMLILVVMIIMPMLVVMVYDRIHGQINCFLFHYFTLKYKNVLFFVQHVNSVKINEVSS